MRIARLDDKQLPRRHRQVLAVEETGIGLPVGDDQLIGGVDMGIVDEIGLRLKEAAVVQHRPDRVGVAQVPQPETRFAVETRLVFGMVHRPPAPLS